MATGRLPDPNTAPVTAKGDLYTYSTVPAKLAVGSNGETLVADSSATTGLRWSAVGLANPVINGGMDIWQRGTSAVTLSAAAFNYTADRWFVSRSVGTSGVTATQATSIGLDGFQYALRIQRTNGNTSTGTNYLNSNIETSNSIPFANKTVTLSFYARAGANYSATSNALTVVLRTGTGTDQSGYPGGWTGAAIPINQTATLTTSWQRFTYSATLGSTATQIGVQFESTPTGTAGVNDWFDITGVQIDVGSVALPFRRSGGTLAGELAACQRYYQLIASGNAKNICNVAAYNSSSVFGTYFTKVSMRTAPTISVVTGTDYYGVAGNNGSDGTTTVGLALASENQVRLEVQSGITVVQGYAYWIDTTNAAAFLAVQAEL